MPNSTRNSRVAWRLVLGLSVVLLATAPAGGVEPQQPLLGFDGRLVDLPARVLPTMGNLPSRGMRVERLRFGSPAQQIGLEPGDMIVSIDGMRFTSHAGYLHALRVPDSAPR